MKIEVGEYIRTKNGIIAKVTYVDGLMLDTDMDVFDVGNTMMMEIPTEFVEEYVVKHSKNIIDLIEVGDIVEYEYDGYYHKADIFQSTYYNLAIASVNDGIIDLEERHEIIKRILTKEQYEQNSYKL